MPVTLWPIRVKILIKADGKGALYPDFNSLPVVQASGQDWSHYVDQAGSGWIYSCCGHREEEPGSPMGQQWGMLMVPSAFASEAVAAFPAVVTQLTDSEAATFYDDDHAKNFDEEVIDDAVLHAIRAKKSFVPPIPLTAHQNKAIDPADPTPGIRPNQDKTFAGYKSKRGITTGT